MLLLIIYTYTQVQYNEKISITALFAGGQRAINCFKIPIVASLQSMDLNT